MVLPIGTCSIVNRYSLKESRIKMLHLPSRLGKGGSIISAVLQSNLKEYVTYMDSDLAADPSEVERLLEYIEDYDLVTRFKNFTWRFSAYKRPILRSFFLAFVLKII